MYPSVEWGVQECLRAGEVVGECDAPEDDLKEDEEEGVDDLGHAVEVLGHPERVIVFLHLHEVLGASINDVQSHIHIRKHP